MKDQATKERYIELRASGKSYRAIAEELNISKSTCSSWEKELEEKIREAKADREQELIDTYQLSRENRIARLSSTLSQIDNILTERGLEDVSTEKLLKIKLDYERELRTEYREPAIEAPEQSISGVLEAYANLYRDSRAGIITPNETKTQIAILESTLKAINAKEADSLFSI